MEDVIPVSRLIRSTMPAAYAFFVLGRTLISARNPHDALLAASRNRHRFVVQDVENTFSRCVAVQSRDVTSHLADAGPLPRDINYSSSHTSRLFSMRREIVWRVL